MKVLDRLRQWARTVKRDGVALWFACRHPGTPLAAKALGVFVVAYALSPIDLIPDFVPVLGYLDDVLLLPGLIWLAIRLVPTGTCWRSAASGVTSGWRAAQQSRAVGGARC